MADQIVAKGNTLRIIIDLYTAAGTNPVDPDECPEGPRIAFYQHDGTTLVDKASNLPYTRRLAPGVFELILPIPYSADFLPPNNPGETYKVKVAMASKGGVDLVGPTGSPFVQNVRIVSEPDRTAVMGDDRLYATPQELIELTGLEDPSLTEVRRAQAVLDGWMKRSLFPTVISGERHDIPQGRNQVMLDVVPVIRLLAADATKPVEAAGLKGRPGPGRRDNMFRSVLNSDYMAMFATLTSPPKLTPVDVSQCSLHESSGEIWLTSGLYLLSYSQVEVTYEAGLRVIPREAKMGLATTIAWIRFKGFSNLKNWSIGGTSRDTGESLIPDDVKEVYEKWRVKILR